MHPLPHNHGNIRHFLQNLRSNHRGYAVWKATSDGSSAKPPYAETSTEEIGEFSVQIERIYRFAAQEALKLHDALETSEDSVPWRYRRQERQIINFV